MKAIAWFLGCVALFVICAGLALGFIGSRLLPGDPDGEEFITTVSEHFSGTAFLTADDPDVEIPVMLTLDGAPADALHLSVGVDAIPHGDTMVDLSQLLVTETITGPGAGTVKIELVPVDAGPVEVRWQLIAVVQSDSVTELTLTADAPPDTFGPAPALNVGFTRGPLAPIPARRLQVEVQPQGAARLVLPTIAGRFRRVATEDGLVALAPDQRLIDLELPQRCLAVPAAACTFDVIVTSPQLNGLDHRLIVLAARGEVEVIDLGQPEWNKVTIAGTTDSATISETQREAMSVLSVDIELPSDPLAAALAFARLDADVQLDELPLDYSGRPPSLKARLSSYWIWADNCCRGVDLTVSASSLPKEFEVVDASASWSVTVWSPVAPVEGLQATTD